jgi:hypothetical protein
VLPRLGSLLARAVTRQRLLRVVERAEAARGPADDRARILRAFYAAAARAPAETDAQPPPALPQGERDALLALAAADPAAAALIARVAPGAAAVLRGAGLVLTDSGDGPLDHHVPTDFPGCYGNDPGVDETVRRVLREAAQRLGPRVPMARWRRFEDLTVRLVQIARDLRNDLPPFMLRAEEVDGLGQRASEDDLQRYVFDVLRGAYGTFAHWEPTRIAGGRGDAGVFFPEARFPIEVKAEFRDVGRAHVRGAYLTQPERYASDRDGISFLLVLDLRATHAAPTTALYGLRDSFWVDGLAPDPQITDPHANAIVVGLLPGNQPKPSSTTTYSRRPPARRRDSAANPGASGARRGRRGTVRPAGDESADGTRAPVE